MLIAFLYDTLGRYLRYRTQLATIGELDDRILRDIGISRGDLKAVAWDSASHWAAHSIRSSPLADAAKSQGASAGLMARSLPLPRPCRTQVQHGLPEAGWRAAPQRD